MPATSKTNSNSKNNRDCHSSSNVGNGNGNGKETTTQAPASRAEEGALALSRLVHMQLGPDAAYAEREHQKLIRVSAEAGGAHAQSRRLSLPWWHHHTAQEEEAWRLRMVDTDPVDAIFQLGPGLRGFLAQFDDEQRQQHQLERQQQRWVEPGAYFPTIVDLARGAGSHMLQEFCMVVAEWRGWA